MAALILNLYYSINNSNNTKEKKIIAKITEDLEEEDKFNLKLENVIGFKEKLEEIVNTFCYGIVVYAIPTKYKTIGDILKTTNLITKPN